MATRKPLTGDEIAATLDDPDEPESESPALASPFEGMTPTEQQAKLVAMLKECTLLDDVAVLFKRAISQLEKAGLKREAIWALLQERANAYLAGAEFPPMANVVLLDAGRFGVDRRVLVAAAREAGISRGANPAKNMRDRLAATAAAEVALGVEIPAAALLDHAERIHATQRLVRRSMRRRAR